MKILFITPYIPSLIRVRPYNFIKYLSRRGHQITLLALVPPGESTDSLTELRQWCRQVQTVPLPRWRTLWNGLRALPGSTPLQAAYSRSPEMATLVRQTLAADTFDVVHVEHLRGAELAPTSAPVVFDSVDSITLLFELVRQAGPTRRSRLLAALDLARTRRYEGRLLARFPRVLVTSPRDKARLAELAPPDADTERIVVLPNGVDLAYFAPADTPRQPATVVFTGKMSYHANIAAALDLAHRVMPLVWQTFPQARLVLAGKDPPPELLGLSAEARITVTGSVPDLRPYLAQATVAVTPIRYGVGIQNKVLEAMAMAAPVVSTPQAVSALQVEPGREVLVGESPQALAEAIVALLSNADLQRRVGQAGRRFVERHHDWDAIAARLETVYEAARADRV
ncbi:MAG: glycosyltransferase, partial [Chloroflexi bacterium]